MTNAVYPKFKEAALTAAFTSLLTTNIKAILVDGADYTYSAAHDFLNDISAGIEETSGNLASKTATNGIFDAADVPFSGTAGDGCEIVILYVDTGTSSTSHLIVYIDVASGLPVTLGGDVTVRWNASGIFEI